MTFTHDDIQNRLIEFLYGELDGDARAAFEAHLAACERCRAEVAEFQKTREVARSAVRVGLEDEVPAGVRARLLEAAAAAKVSAGASGAATTRAPAGAAARKPLPPKSEGDSKSEAAGPFAWLRARWAVPMFVTVAAMGALLLVRETIYREARKPLGDSPAPAATAPAPAEPVVRSHGPSLLGESRPPGSGLEEAAEPVEAKREVFREQPQGARLRPATENASGGRATRSAPADHHVAKAKAAKAKAPSPNDSIDDLLSGAETPRRETRKPEARKPQKGDISDDILGGLETDKSSTRGFAQPPPPRAVAAPRAPAPAAPAAPPTPASSSAIIDRDSDRDRDRDREDADERPQRAQEAARKRAVLGKAEEREAPAAAAEVHAVSAAESDDDAAPPDAAAPLAARAEKLMASRQWGEAAAAYRQLIARFPKHEQVPNWRRRLAVVEAAARAARPSK